MFLLKGIFIFSGKKDIERKDIQKGIIIKVEGEGSKWYSNEIIDKTENLDVKISTDNSTLNIDFDLLTDKDYFVIEALGESDIQTITYSHRIANVSKIETGKIDLSKTIKASIWRYIFLIAFFLFFLVMLKPLKIDSYNLQSTFYDNSKNIVSRESLIDTSDLDKEIPSYLSGESRITYRNILKQEAKINFIGDHSDSLAKIAAKEYSQLDLLISRKTKLYRLDKNYLVSFSHSIQWMDIAFACFVIIMLLIVLINLSGQVIYYLKYNKISELAFSLMKKH